MKSAFACGAAALLLSAASAAVPGFVWIEVEDFAEKGDWQVDTQFTHVMGSAYLICPGLDRPTRNPALNDGWAYPAYDRTVRGRMNASRGWESEPSLPQTATLEWPAPVELGEVQVVFDSELKVQNLDAMPRCLVKAYRLDVRTASGWERMADVNENFLRVGLHRFAAKKADALRVTVRSTWGDACARVFEIRAYAPVAGKTESLAMER